MQKCCLVFISVTLFFFFGGGKGVWGDVGEGGGSNPLGCVMCEHLPNKKNLYFILVELN